MNKYTMDDFIAGKFAVMTGEGPELKRFLDMCEERGLKWESKDNAKDYDPSGMYSDYLTLAYAFDDFSGLGCSDKDYFVGEGLKVIDFFELTPDEKPKKKYDILIQCRGDKTEAHMYVNGVEVKTTKARRNPADKFSFRIGAQTAFDRLWERSKK